MEELNLSFEFTILVPTHCAIWAHSNDILQKRVHRDPLHHFLVSIKRLYLSKLPLSCAPQNRSPIDRAGHKAAGVPRPAYVHDVADVASELAGVPPLHSLLLLAELSGEQLEGPHHHHLVVGARRQVLTTRGKSYYVHCWGVSTLQIVPIFWDPLDWAVLLGVLD